MKTYTVLTTLSTAEGTHIYPGSTIGLLDDVRAAALVQAGALVLAEPATVAPASVPEAATYPAIVDDADPAIT